MLIRSNREFVVSLSLPLLANAVMSDDPFLAPHSGQPAVISCPTRTPSHYVLTTAFAQKRIEPLIELTNLQIEPLHSPLPYSKDPQRWIGIPGFCDIGLGGDVLHLGQLKSRSYSYTKGAKPPGLHKCCSFDLILAGHLIAFGSLCVQTVKDPTDNGTKRRTSPVQRRGS